MGKRAIKAEVVIDGRVCEGGAGKGLKKRNLQRLQMGTRVQGHNEKIACKKFGDVYLLVELLTYGYTFALPKCTDLLTHSRGKFNKDENLTYSQIQF